MEWIYAIVTILSLVASIFAWVSKIMWSRQYKAAKESQIDSLNETVNLLKLRNDSLKDFTSDKIMQLYKATKEGLEKFNDKVILEKESLQTQVEELNSKIVELKKKNEKMIPKPDFSELTKMSEKLGITVGIAAKSYSKQFSIMSEQIAHLQKSMEYDPIKYWELKQNSKK